MATKKKAAAPKRAGAKVLSKSLALQVDREEDGRFIAEISSLPGVLAYGPTRQAAIAHAKALALRVIAERIEHDEPLPRELGGWARHLTQVSFTEQPSL